MPGAPLPPAGWHPDPSDGTQLRYWDGQRWTEHTQPLSIPLASTASVAKGMPWWQTWWAVVPGLLVCAPLGLVGLWKRGVTSRTVKIVVTTAVAVLWIAAISTSDESPKDSTAAADSSKTSTESPSPSTPSSVQASSTIPPVTGLTAQQAKRELRASGLGPVEVVPVPSRKPRGTVLSVSPAEDSVVSPGTAVQIEVAAPLPRVPDVVGMKRAEARSVLEAAGFKVTMTAKRTTSGTDNSILRQFPAASRAVNPGTTVRLVVSDLHKPAPAPANCTSGYSPCLPPASDYDCAGGSGDGPAYTGPVLVTGSDPYDLDRDGDGHGCD